MERKIAGFLPCSQARMNYSGKSAGGGKRAQIKVKRGGVRFVLLFFFWGGGKHFARMRWPGVVRRGPSAGCVRVKDTDGGQKSDLVNKRGNLIICCRQFSEEHH